MRIPSILLISLTILACESATPFENEPLIGKIGENIDIPHGRTAIFPDEGITVEILDVDDGRCIYTKIRCVWFGNAEVAFRIDGEDVSLNTTTPYPKEVMVKGLTITLLALAPHETDTWPVQKKKYVATIRVTN